MASKANRKEVTDKVLSHVYDRTTHRGSPQITHILRVGYETLNLVALYFDWALLSVYLPVPRLLLFENPCTL